MSNHQMEQQAQANQQKLREAEVHTQLETLQTWNAQAGPELKAERAAHRERMVRHQRELNAELLANAQQQLPQAQAQAAAPGAPVQQQKAAQQTYKQSKAQEKKLKEAQDHTNGKGTLETYEVKEQIAALLKEQKNSRTPYLKEAEEKKVDTRVLNLFCEGYRKNRLGRPATAEDRAKKERDQAFLEDYLSRDLQRRQPHLERFKQELMEFPVTQDTVSDAYLVKNAARLKQITDRACYFENVMKDPINAPYFNALPPEELAVLDRKLELLAFVALYFVNQTKAMGVESTFGEYIGKILPEMRGMAENARVTLTENMQSMTADCRNAVEESVTRRAERERDVFLYPVKEALRSMQRQEDGPSIEFSQPAFREVYDQMRALRELIASDPAVYRANRAIIDPLYQDAYRTMDLCNDMKMEEQLYLGVAGKYDAGGSFMERTKKAAAVEKVREYQEQLQAYTRRVEAITNALNYCLKGETLTAEGWGILHELGLTRQVVEGLTRRRPMRRGEHPGNAANGGNPDAAANGGNPDAGTNDGNADAAPQE